MEDYLQMMKILDLDLDKLESKSLKKTGGCLLLMRQGKLWRDISQIWQIIRNIHTQELSKLLPS